MSPCFLLSSLLGSTPLPLRFCPDVCPSRAALEYDDSISKKTYKCNSPDYVHMLVSIPPWISVASFMGYLKGKSALMVFDRHQNLKYKFGSRHFWADGYYVSTVGLNAETVRKYIREQEMADIAHDKVTG